MRRRARRSAASSTASGSIIWSACIAPTSGRSTSRCSRSSRRPTNRRSSRSASARRASIRRAAPRSSPRISAPCPTSCARRCSGWGCRASRCFAGSAHWNAPGQPFIDPAEYPEGLGRDDRHARHRAAGAAGGKSLPGRRTRADPRDPGGRAASPPARSRPRSCESPTLPADLNDAMLRRCSTRRRALTIFPMQDLFGWRDRINTPAQVDDENWTWRLPWPVDRLDEIPRRREPRASSSRSGPAPPGGRGANDRSS